MGVAFGPEWCLCRQKEEEGVASSSALLVLEGVEA